MIVINIKNVEETKKKAAIVSLHFFIRMKIDRQPSIKYKKKTGNNSWTKCGTISTAKLVEISRNSQFNGIKKGIIRCSKACTEMKFNGFYQWSIKDECDSLCGLLLHTCKRNAIKTKTDQNNKTSTGQPKIIKLTQKKKKHRQRNIVQFQNEST